MPSVELYEPLASCVVPLRVRGALSACAAAAGAAAHGVGVASAAAPGATPAGGATAGAPATEPSPARRKRAKSGTGGGGADRPRQPSDQLLSADAETPLAPDGGGGAGAGGSGSPDVSPGARRCSWCRGGGGGGGGAPARIPDEALGLPMVDAHVTAAGASVVAGAARYARAVPATFLAHAISGFVAAWLVPPLLAGLGLGVGA